MGFAVFVNSLIYFCALVAALFLILALQIMFRILNWNQKIWNQFPHSYMLEPTGRPKTGYRRRLIILLVILYLLILAGLVTLTIT